MLRKFHFIQLATLVVLSVVLFHACLQTKHAESIVYFGESGWTNKDTIVKHLYIKDTAEKHFIYFITKHSNQYPYKNLWVEISITDPKGNTETAPQELLLANNNIGWLGSGFGNIFEEKIFWRSFQAKEKGDYTIKCSHINRTETLKDFKSFSISVTTYLP